MIRCGVAFLVVLRLPRVAVLATNTALALAQQQRELGTHGGGGGSVANESGARTVCVSRSTQRARMSAWEGRKAGTHTANTRRNVTLDCAWQVTYDDQRGIVLRFLSGPREGQASKTPLIRLLVCLFGFSFGLRVQRILSRGVDCRVYWCRRPVSFRSML